MTRNVPDQVSSDLWLDVKDYSMYRCSYLHSLVVLVDSHEGLVISLVLRDRGHAK